MPIRSATVSDHHAIRDIAHRTWPSTFGSILSRQQIAYMLDLMYSPAALLQQVDDGLQFLLAEFDQQVLGFAGYQPNYLPDTTKLHKLYVLPEHHGQGHGKALTRAVEAFAKTANNHTLRLDVNRHNPAVAFYEKTGFTKVDEIVTAIGEGYVMDDFVYERSL